MLGIDQYHFQARIGGHRALRRRGNKMHRQQGAMRQQRSGDSDGQETVL